MNQHGQITWVKKKKSVNSVFIFTSQFIKASQERNSSRVRHRAKSWWGSDGGVLPTGLLSPQGWMSQLVFGICWNPRTVASNTTEGMDLLAMWGQGEKEQRLPSSAFLFRLPTEWEAQVKSVSSCLKSQIKVVYLPTSKFQIKSEYTYFKLDKRSFSSHKAV